MGVMRCCRLSSSHQGVRLVGPLLALRLVDYDNFYALVRHAGAERTQMLEDDTRGAV